MLTILFRSRLKPELAEEYDALLAQVEPLGEGMAGFVSKKTFAAEDGERLTVVRWQDRETLDAWRQHPDHQRAKRLGRERFYESYSLEIFEDPEG